MVATALAMILAPQARAQGAASDSTLGAPRVQAADTLAAGHEKHKPFFSSPTGVMLRSLVVPGWGQATNGAWVKAVLVAGGESALIATLIRDSNKLKDLDPNSVEYNDVYDRRNREAWWLGGVVFLSMVDAFVDAHLKGFDVELGPEPSENQLRVSARIELP
jgi:hypothetical protein